MQKFTESETLSAPVEMPALAALRDPITTVRIHGTSFEIPLPPERRRFTVGSGDRCNVTVDDPYASTTHCVLERQQSGAILVRDRRSKNGTYLNGNRIEVAQVTPGSLLLVGQTLLVLVSESGRGRMTAVEQLVGHDAIFREAVDRAVKAAVSRVNVLVVGETGTGKELVARAVHESSPRSAGPFVALNCGAIPRDLIGSELFGHAKGSFTGAVNDRDGVFVRAHMGTLFLDELGELPLVQQPHLLRVLEARTVRRVGEHRERSVDVRVVAATNRVDELGTRRSLLRLDLYHRLAGVVIHLPPLRERKDDIPMLVHTFIHELAGPNHPYRLRRAVLRGLQRYAWPGNVRELRQSVQRALALSSGDLALEDFLPPGSGGGHPEPVVPEVSNKVIREPRANPPRTRADRRHRGRPRAELVENSPVLAPVEAHVRDLMMDALDKYGSIRRAAEALGVPKSTFLDRAKRYGIKTNRDDY